MLTKSFTFAAGSKRVVVKPSGVAELHTFDNTERTAINYAVIDGSTVHSGGMYVPANANRAYVVASLNAKVEA